MGNRKTGVFATEKEKNDLIKAWNNALNTPVMTFTMGGPDLASGARNIVIDRINKLAKEKGLPDIDDNYGIDLETGEFLNMGE